MQLPRLLLAALSAAITNSAPNSGPTDRTKPFKLRTALRSGQPSTKSRFENQYLYSYHTGAGLGDATLSDNSSSPSSTLVPSNLTDPNHNGAPLYGIQVAVQGTEGFPWGIIPLDSAVSYAAWQPVRMNIGNVEATNYSAFYIEDGKLLWTDVTSAQEEPRPTNGFGGWLVCDWWHGVPQLFFRRTFYEPKSYPTLESCADVDLVADYV